MKIAVMQPYLFPYIGYIQLIKAVDIFVIFDDVNFINKGWINRNNILLNGQKHLWTLSLNKASQNRLIKDIDIFEPEKSKKKLLDLFYTAYKNSKYYKEFFPILSEIMEDKSENIVDFIENSFTKLGQYLSLRTKFIRSSSIANPNNLRAEERIIDIVKFLEGKNYINLIGGTELYSKDNFLQEGVELNFIRMGDIIYNQNLNNFIPSLSIVDLLFSCDKNMAQNILNDYELM